MNQCGNSMMGFNYSSFYAQLVVSRGQLHTRRSTSYQGELLTAPKVNCRAAQVGSQGQLHSCKSKTHINQCDISKMRFAPASTLSEASDSPSLIPAKGKRSTLLLEQDIVSQISRNQIFSTGSCAGSKTGKPMLAEPT
eukprot:TRINITY_DN64028_c0_g1_i1.p1 TRINITY_DN64028_c0_g1~~TRINITY_DN64028_c0_g1_i1.p1  ORF type:complete len:138 (+),score=18.33 TRINITY_DN64028_c0_g1_i1:345-758(+)